MRDIKYIIKRIIIGVGIALVLGYLRGGLIGNAYALSPTTITAYDTTNSNCTTTCNDSFCNFYFSSSCKIDRISVRNNSYSLIDTGRYELFTSIVIGQELQTLNIRSDKYLGNYQATQWNNLTQTWNNIDNITLGNNGFYNVEWGSAYTFTSSFNSGGVTFDFYFASRQDINYVRVKRFELVNTGSSTTDAINNNTNQIINSQNNNTQEIINNNNNNTQNIINNQNNNTQSIINNQNTNTDKEIESQRVCSFIDKNNVVAQGKYLNNQGSISVAQGWGVTDYISVTSSSVLTFSTGYTANTSTSSCFYNINKVKISCFTNGNSSDNSSVTIPSTASYFRTTINLDSNKPVFKLCNNGNQAISDTNKAINDTLNNDDVTGATSEGNSFFNNFTVNSHGLSGIITAPLRLINSLSSSTCSSLVLPLPFVEQNATLPCMSTVYSLYPTFYNLWQVISTGVIAYMIIIKIFGHIKGMQDPTDDKIEVINL